MTCRSCAERRRRLLLERQRKKEEGRKVQAAALGAVMAVTEVAGKALGIKGEDDGRDSNGTEQDSGGN